MKTFARSNIYYLEDLGKKLSFLLGCWVLVCCNSCVAYYSKKYKRSEVRNELMIDEVSPIAIDNDMKK